MTARVTDEVLDDMASALAPVLHAVSCVDYDQTVCARTRCERRATSPGALCTRHSDRPDIETVNGVILWNGGRSDG